MNTDTRQDKKKIFSLDKMFSNIGLLITSLILLIYFIAIAYPLFWMVMNSFKDTQSIITESWSMPEEWLFSNYASAWELGVSTYFINSVIVTGVTCIITVVCSALCAYALSRFKIKGRNLLLLVVSSGLMFAPQVAIVPLYDLSISFNLYDTYWALILPYAAFRLPLTISKELEESALIDGCSRFGIFYRIILPMSKPIIFTSIILSAYYVWNEILFAVIFIESDELKPISAGLLAFRDALKTDWGVLM